MESNPTTHLKDDYNTMYENYWGHNLNLTFAQTRGPFISSISEKTAEERFNCVCETWQVDMSDDLSTVLLPED